MANRREFIQGGLLALPAALSLADGAAARPFQSAGPSFHRVLVDERFAESRAFGREASRLGETVATIQGDVTDFWYRELHQQWQGEALPIAGLTAHGPLFCLERWAWDAGLRVVFRAEHRQAGQGLVHRFEGPEAVLADARASISGPAWPAQMARLAVACRQDLCAPAQALINTPGQPVGLGDEDALISWVIAPRPNRA